MRWIITILTFYLMVLSSLPCSDGNNRCEDNSNTTEIVQSHDHNQDKDDDCSPFCYCSCCSISITYYNFKSFEIRHPRVAFITKKITIRDYTLISNYYGSIWHPPKFTV
ncbi:DUF6660 family protein [Flavobacterium columnare]|uniref:DUF6660 family protein n=1 Tax=Flavobacterium columnare TaxID=996 RepID=UPI00374D4AD7